MAAVAESAGGAALWDAAQADVPSGSGQNRRTRPPPDEQPMCGVSLKQFREHFVLRTFSSSADSMTHGPHLDARKQFNITK